MLFSHWTMHVYVIIFYLIYSNELKDKTGTPKSASKNLDLYLELDNRQRNGHIKYQTDICILWYIYYTEVHVFF